jgi:hypothetical protein
MATRCLVGSAFKFGQVRMIRKEAGHDQVAVFIEMQHLPNSPNPPRPFLPTENRALEVPFHAPTSVQPVSHRLSPLSETYRPLWNCFIAIG